MSRTRESGCHLCQAVCGESRMYGLTTEGDAEKPSLMLIGSFGNLSVMKMEGKIVYSWSVHYRGITSDTIWASRCTYFVVT